MGFLFFISGNIQDVPIVLLTRLRPKRVQTLAYSHNCSLANELTARNLLIQCAANHGKLILPLKTKQENNASPFCWLKFANLEKFDEKILTLLSITLNNVKN